MLPTGKFRKDKFPIKCMFLYFCLCVIFLLGLAGPDFAENNNPAVSRGFELFSAHCAVCHRSSGAGGISFGAVRSADLRAPGLEKTYRFDDNLILRAILFGVDQNGVMLSPPMPVWRGRLSVADTKAIIAYLHTLHS